MLHELRAAADAVAEAGTTLDSVTDTATTELGAAGARADAGLDALARTRAAEVVQGRGGEDAVWAAVRGDGVGEVEGERGRREGGE